MWIWNPRVFLVIILSYVALSFYEPFWRLLIRGLLEPNFTWNYAGFKGSGVLGDYWVIFIIIILGMCMLFFGWRGGNRIVQWSIFIWVFLLFSSSLVIILSDPKTKIVAETLQVELPYMWVILPFDALFFILTTVWIIFFRKMNRTVSRPRWKCVNSTLVAVAIGLIPVEYILFNAGEQHGLLDGVGVFVTLIQWLILNLAFYPWNTRKVFSNRITYFDNNIAKRYNTFKY
jgi:hypothetical protein